MAKRLIGSVGLAPGTDTGTDLTTKGDLHGYSDTNTRVPIGDDDQVLTADSGEALGLKWAATSGGANTALSNLSSVAVNATIDMNSNILTNVKSGAGYAKLEEIESYEEASATGSTKTFTLTQDNLDLYDSLILTYSLISSAAFNLEMTVNGLTSAYSYSISEDSDGTFTNSTGSAQSQWVVMDSTIINTDTITPQGQIMILPSEGNTGDGRAGMLCSGGVSAGTAGNAWGTGLVTGVTLSSFGSITIQTSTSTWQRHSRFNLMGKRK